MNENEVRNCITENTSKVCAAISDNMSVKNILSVVGSLPILMDIQKQIINASEDVQNVFISNMKNIQTAMIEKIRDLKNESPNLDQNGSNPIEFWGKTLELLSRYMLKKYDYDLSDYEIIYQYLKPNFTYIIDICDKISSSVDKMRRCRSSEKTDTEYKFYNALEAIKDLIEHLKLLKEKKFILIEQLQKQTNRDSTEMQDLVNYTENVRNRKKQYLAIDNIAKRAVLCGGIDQRFNEISINDLIFHGESLLHIRAIVWSIHNLKTFQKHCKPTETEINGRSPYCISLEHISLAQASIRNLLFGFNVLGVNNDEYDLSGIDRSMSTIKILKEVLESFSNLHCDGCGMVVIQEKYQYNTEGSHPSIEFLVSTLLSECKDIIKSRENIMREGIINKNLDNATTPNYVAKRVNFAEIMLSLQDCKSKDKNKNETLIPRM